MLSRNYIFIAALGWIATASTAVLCVNACAQSRIPPVAQMAPAQPVSQENGKYVTLPPNGIPSRKSGLHLNVDTYWVNGYGYRPVEVTVQSPKPTTADHLITIRLHSGYEND